MTAFYNEIDPFAAAWLRELIRAGHIAPGVVDERSIEDIHPHELTGFKQCHFFAGVGVWSYALRRAGWPDDRPVWTGSCPCQPFSAAGKGGGFADERHLWPAFFHLIGECRPDVVLGEQVASKDGLAWLNLVQADLEGAGYTSGAVDTCAAGFGAPHIRQRLYWLAYRDSYQSRSGRNAGSSLCEGFRLELGRRNAAERLADGLSSGQPRQGRRGPAQGQGASELRGASRLADSGLAGLEGCDTRSMGVECSSAERDRRSELARQSSAGPTNGLWRDVDWLFCRDGKWRPVEPGTLPLAHGAPARVGRLRGYGNAINAEQAKGFIEAVMECQQ